jgi:hypothetical protein
MASATREVGSSPGQAQPRPPQVQLGLKPHVGSGALGLSACVPTTKFLSGGRQGAVSGHPPSEDGKEKANFRFWDESAEPREVADVVRLRC